jgi:hypothetical protein
MQCVTCCSSSRPQPLPNVLPAHILVCPFIFHTLIVVTLQGAEGVVNDVVWAEESDWEQLVRDAAAGGLAEASFMDALQRKMEGTVLGMQSGSYAQRVQAEYLKEVEARAKSVFRALAAAA